MSSYLVNLMANSLAEQGHIELPLRWENPLAPYQNKDKTPELRFLCSEELINLLASHGKTQPYNHDWLSSVIQSFSKELFLDHSLAMTSVEGYYFHQRHNKEKKNMRINIPLAIDDILVQISDRTATTRMMVLTQALVWYFQGVKVQAA